MSLSKTSPPQDFGAVTIKLASPERIREWSYGEVTKAETINYRTQRAERNGLFDERIFGPERDYECYCGKYRRIRYKDIICEKCGVEVTRSIVRRERMGHIELASPVAHIWFLRGIPSRVATLLGQPVIEVEKVVYFSGYIVTKVNESEKQKFSKDLESEYKSKVKSLQTALAKDQLKVAASAARAELATLSLGRIIDEIEYHRLSLKYSSVFEAQIGAEAIYNIFRNLDLKKLFKDLQNQLVDAPAATRLKITKRFNLVKTLLRSGVRPEWMFLKVIPIIPPALRPMVALDGGRHATSDVNDLYRRVINRNNRLKKLLELKAPEVILRNEKRILQEAVDALIDNSISQRDTALTVATRRPLKSLADNLKGKQGRFRQNLLGKRVDYSGRSVIVVGPELHLNQCGLPKHMALELFRPFVIAKLLERELAFNIRGAGKLIDEGVPEVWEILEEVTSDKYVLLNRAPTLHRLGIQAFKPVLIEGNAIQVHPLVCKAFNADFDGDQMAVHVPLSPQAQREARELMSSSRNLLGPGNNEPIVTPPLDIVLGCYFITKIIESKDQKIRYFSSPNEAILTHDYGVISGREKIKVLPTDSPKYAEFGANLFETSVGRLLFNSILPDDFPYINREIRKSDIAGIVEELIYRYGIDATPPVLDKIKDFGFAWAKRSGITWGIDDVLVPEGKGEVVKVARAKVRELEEHFNEGLISEDEKYRMSIEIWQGTKSEVEKLLQKSLDPNGPVTEMLISGARGALVNVSQMVGMKGLIVNPAGEVFNFPIIPSYKEGLSPIEYFVSTHGARKGLADTALKTAKAGYLTRRLVYVADCAIIAEEDCGDNEGRFVDSSDFSVLEPSIMPHIRGRVLAADIKDGSGKVIYKKGTLIGKRDALTIAEAGVAEARVRSPLSCRTLRGLCQVCYGLDLARNKLVEIGEAVGVIAAQATGEPGTQLTMRTFHTGGIASAGGDITMGLPRVEEVFERRIPKNPTLLSEVAGLVAEIKNSGQDRVITVLTDKKSDKKSKSETVDYTVSPPRSVIVKKGDRVLVGTFLTDGPADLRQLFRLAGLVATEKYIIREIHKIYEMQGASIDRKHIEIIARQMFNRRRIIDGGDSRFVIGEVIEHYELEVENERVRTSGGGPAVAEEIIVGISDAALTTASFLSAASFENTQRVLTTSAISASVDNLRGIKENVILGRLIPAGPKLKSST